MRCGSEHSRCALAAASRRWSRRTNFSCVPAFLIEGESHIPEPKTLNRMNPTESNPHMKIKSALSLLAAASLALSSAAFAAGSKTYEVTGPVLEVNDSMIVVQKGKDRWEINRDANTKVTGDVKVGDKVHIAYTMSAANVEVKAGKGAKKEGAKAAP